MRWEHHVRQSPADDIVSAVGAEVITPRGSVNPTLVVYLVTGEAADGPNRVQEAIQQATQGLQERLGKQLPGYMVPSACIPVDEIPTTVTGKMDRRRLREIGGAMRREQLAALQPARGERRAATTATERRLQDLWASILGLEAGSTAADYNFLRIGGDSIGAMRLVEVARNHGLSFTVADVLSNPSLGALAGALSEIHTLR